MESFSANSIIVSQVCLTLFVVVSVHVIFREILWCWSVHACYYRMVSLIWLECHHIYRAELFLLKFLYFVLVDDLRCNCAVNACCFDGNHKMTSVFDEHVCIVCENTGLIRLRNICKDDIDHRHKHAILLWMTGIFDDWHDVRAFLCHIDKITSNTL